MEGVRSAESQSRVGVRLRKEIARLDDCVGKMLWTVGNRESRLRWCVIVTKKDVSG